MRKILNIMAIALAIFCRIPVEVHGQSFLKKLKQKVGNVVGTKDDTAEIGAALSAMVWKGLMGDNKE